jgi:hypothetical protein
MFTCCGFAVRGAGEMFKLRGGRLQRYGIEKSCRVVLNPCPQAAVEDVVRHRGFELRVSAEEDDGEEAGLRQVEKRHQGADVEGVLMERVLEKRLLRR